MTRPLAMTLAAIFILLAAACIEEEEGEPTRTPPPCEVDHGHLCGDSAPGVECPPNMVCVKGGGYDTCWRRCSKGQDDSVCVPDICKGAACADNYTCTYFGDYPVRPTPAEYSCADRDQVYACTDLIGSCEAPFIESQGWCLRVDSAWEGSGL